MGRTIRNDCKHHGLFGICLGTYVDDCDIHSLAGRDCTGCGDFIDRGYYLQHGHPSVVYKEADHD